MKPQILERIKVGDNGVWLDSWQKEMPRVFHTAAARALFAEAEKKGLLIHYEELGCYGRAPGITLGQLGYWCALASTYLGLDRGEKHQTSWKPFETVFAEPRRSLSRAANRVGFDETIEAFFTDLNTDNNTINDI